VVPSTLKGTIKIVVIKSDTPTLFGCHEERAIKLVFIRWNKSSWATPWKSRLERHGRLDCTGWFQFSVVVTTSGETFSATFIHT
jgi:hypothetical protein